MDAELSASITNTSFILREHPVSGCVLSWLLSAAGAVLGLQLIALTELADEKKGYVVDDTLVLEARVILLEDMESMDSEVTFDVRRTNFSVLKSSLQVR